MFPHDRIVEQLYAVLRVETAAKKIEVMIFFLPTQLRRVAEYQNISSISATKLVETTPENICRSDISIKDLLLVGCLAVSPRVPQGLWLPLSINQRSQRTLSNLLETPPSSASGWPAGLKEREFVFGHLLKPRKGVCVCPKCPKCREAQKH